MERKIGDRVRTKRNARSLPAWLRGLTGTIVGFESCSPSDSYCLVRFDCKAYDMMRYPLPCYAQELCKGH